MDIDDQINKEMQIKNPLVLKTIDDSIEDIFDVFSNGVNATCYKEGRTALTVISGNITFYDIKNDFKSLHNLFLNGNIGKLIKQNKHQIAKQLNFGKLASSRKKILIIESIFIPVFIASMIAILAFPSILVFIASIVSGIVTAFIHEKEENLFSTFLNDRDKLNNITNKDFLSKEVNSKANYSEDDSSGQNSKNETPAIMRISDIFRKQEYEYVNNNKNGQSSSTV